MQLVLSHRLPEESVVLEGCYDLKLTIFRSTRGRGSMKSISLQSGIIYRVLFQTFAYYDINISKDFNMPQPRFKMLHNMIYMDQENVWLVSVDICMYLP